MKDGFICLHYYNVTRKLCKEKSRSNYILKAYERHTNTLNNAFSHPERNVLRFNLIMDWPNSVKTDIFSHLCYNNDLFSIL